MAGREPSTVGATQPARPASGAPAETVAAPGFGTPVRSSVGMSVGGGVDPMVAAIRGAAVTRREPDRAASERVPVLASRGSATAPLMERGRIGVAAGLTTGATRSRIPVDDRPLAHASRRTTSIGPTKGSAGGDATEPKTPAADPPRATDGGDGPATAGGGSRTVADATEPVTGPCADERRAVDERCALADRMRTLADDAALRLRDTQREYDTHVGLAEEASAIADPRAQRSAKDAAQRSFRTGRESAGSREAVEAAARTWLQEINRINAEARDASATMTTERAAAAPLLAAIEKLTVQADAARVQAESAQESCVMAREALAVCEENQQRDAGTMPLEPSLGPGEAPTGPGSRVPSWSEPVTPILGARPPVEEVNEDSLLQAAMLGGQPAILRLLAGDHAAMQRIVVEVAGDDPEERRRWQLLLADFVDAVLARAIEACAFEFPADHPFWSPFSRSQARDISLALSSLGYRFDGLRGFADERVPSQRDLSLALGYAGLDPMRVRRWPNDTEMASLFADVSVAADEYLSGAASGLTLGELVSMLGRRADPLTDLWNSWGRVRPLLLEPSERPTRS